MLRSIVALATLGLAAAATLPASAARLGAPQRAIAAVVPPLSRVRDLGEAPATTRMSLTVALQIRNKPVLDALVAAQSDSGSPLYRHFLSRQQLRDNFGVSAADYARAALSLQRAGFRVTHVSPLRMTLGIQGYVPTIERYFATSVHRVQSLDGRQSYLANALPARVPAELSDVVVSVLGLTTKPVFQSAFEAVNGSRFTKTAGRPAPAKPLATAVPAFGPDLGYGPAPADGDFRFPERYGFYGNGATVADLFDASFDDTADLAPYFSYFGIKRKYPVTNYVLVDGGCALYGCDDSFPGAIDAETIIGAAPDVKYEVYQVPILSTSGIADGLDQIVSDDTADVVNISFAGCELDLGEASLLASDFVEAGNALGQTFVAVAFGGPAPCDTGQPGTIAPADSPYVLAVGGADTSVDLVHFLANRPPTAMSGSGGGVSYFFGEPSYQNGVVKNGAGRNVPDISGPGAIDGYSPSLYFSEFGGWVGGVYDGDFVNSAPFAGALATIVKYQGHRLGNVNPTLYADFKKYKYGSYFTDVTAGNDGAPAGPGYDTVTGIGVPDFANLAKAI